MRTLLTTLLISATLLASGQAIAAHVTPALVRQIALPALETMQSNGVSLSQAIEQVRRQYKGRILSAETKVSGKQETHHIRVLTQDGTVKNVRVAGKRRG
jgi:hypothetical protein